MRAWSYSRQLTEELSHRPLGDAGEQWAELLGIGLQPREQALGVAAWVLASPLLVRRAYRLAKALGLDVTVDHRRTGHRISYRLRVSGNFDSFVNGARVSHHAAYLRGVFLAHGYMNSPERGLHLELRLHEDGASVVWPMLARMRVKAGRMAHHGGVIVYVKGHDDIARFLAEIGAHRALLQLESLRVMRAMKNQINRLVNSETANLARTVGSGVEQARALAEFAKSEQWERLPPNLLALAEIRLSHPDWSLKEIGQALSPSVSKSAVNHRMRRLMAICSEYRR